MLLEWLNIPLIREAFYKKQMEYGHGLPIASYLHKPVQRVLKYHLLLENLLKYYGGEKEGRGVLEAALTGMVDMARHINEMKREHEHAMKLQEIQSSLYNMERTSLAQLGKLVMEETFKLMGARSSRHLYLFEQGVIIAKKRDDNAFNCKAVIKCHSLMLIESIPKDPLAFHLIQHGSTKDPFVFQAKCMEEKMQWCQAMKRLIVDSFSTLPEKTREQVLQRLSEAAALTHTSAITHDTGKLPPFGKKTSGPTKSPLADFLEKKKRRHIPFSVPDGFLRMKGRNNAKKFTAEPDASGQTAHVEGRAGINEERLSSNSSLSMAEKRLDRRHSFTNAKERLCHVSSEYSMPAVRAYDDLSFKASAMRANLTAEGVYAQLNKSSLTFDEEILRKILAITHVQQAESMYEVNGTFAKFLSEPNKVSSHSPSTLPTPPRRIPRRRNAARKRLSRNSSNCSKASQMSQPSSGEGEGSSILTAECDITLEDSIYQSIECLDQDLSSTLEPDVGQAPDHTSLTDNAITDQYKDSAVGPRANVPSTEQLSGDEAFSPMNASNLPTVGSAALKRSTSSVEQRRPEKVEKKEKSRSDKSLPSRSSDSNLMKIALNFPQKHLSKIGEMLRGGGKQRPKLFSKTLSPAAGLSLAAGRKEGVPSLPAVMSVFDHSSSSESSFTLAPHPSESRANLEVASSTSHVFPSQCIPVSVSGHLPNAASCGDAVYDPVYFQSSSIKGQPSDPTSGQHGHYENVDIPGSTCGNFQYDGGESLYDPVDYTCFEAGEPTPAHHGLSTAPHSSTLFQSCPGVLDSGLSAENLPEEIYDEVPLEEEEEPHPSLLCTDANSLNKCETSTRNSPKASIKVMTFVVPDASMMPNLTNEPDHRPKPPLLPKPIIKTKNQSAVANGRQRVGRDGLLEDPNVPSKLITDSERPKVRKREEELELDIMSHRSAEGPLITVDTLHTPDDAERNRSCSSSRVSNMARSYSTRIKAATSSDQANCSRLASKTSSAATSGRDIGPKVRSQTGPAETSSLSSVSGNKHKRTVSGQLFLQSQMIEDVDSGSDCQDSVLGGRPVGIKGQGSPHDLACSAQTPLRDSAVYSDVESEGSRGGGVGPRLNTPVPFFTDEDAACHHLLAPTHDSCDSQPNDCIPSQLSVARLPTSCKPSKRNSIQVSTQKSLSQVSEPHPFKLSLPSTVESCGPPTLPCRPPVGAKPQLGFPYRSTYSSKAKSESECNVQSLPSPVTAAHPNGGIELASAYASTDLCDSWLDAALHPSLCPSSPLMPRPCSDQSVQCPPCDRPCTSSFSRHGCSMTAHTDKTSPKQVGFTAPCHAGASPLRHVRTNTSRREGSTSPNTGAFQSTFCGPAQRMSRARREPSKSQRERERASSVPPSTADRTIGPRTNLSIGIKARVQSLMQASQAPSTNNQSARKKVDYENLSLGSSGLRERLERLSSSRSTSLSSSRQSSPEKEFVSPGPKFLCFEDSPIGRTPVSNVSSPCVRVKDVIKKLQAQ